MSSIVSWSTKGWEGIKKLPGWAVVAVFLCLSVIVYLVKHSILQKRRAEVQRNLTDITVEYTVAKTEASTRHESEIEALREQREEVREELEAVEAIIDEAAKKGAVGIAKEWKSFLSGGS